MSFVIADEGSYVTVNTVNLSNRLESIPAGVYTVGIVDDEPVLVKDRLKFDLPKRIYGKHVSYRNTIVRTFGETTGTLGILLDGLKGTGKSLLAEDICNKLIEQNLPILLISESVSPSLIKMFISAMGPCVLYFDEFGKFYKEEARDKMLTLFSDSSLKKVMFIVTSNHHGELTDAMIHRPGRFLYKINYKGLMEEEILEIIDDNKIEPAVLSYILDYCKHHQCSFDVVRVLIACAFNADTVQKFVEAISIHNVHNQIHVQYRVKEVTYAGEPFVGDVTVTEEDSVLTITLRDKITTDLVEEHSINWLAAAKVKLTDDGCDFRLKLSDTLTVRIERRVSQWKGTGAVVDLPSRRAKRGFNPNQADPDYEGPVDPWNGPRPGAQTGNF